MLNPIAKLTINIGMRIDFNGIKLYYKDLSEEKDLKLPHTVLIDL